MAAKGELKPLIKLTPEQYNKWKNERWYLNMQTSNGYEWQPCFFADTEEHPPVDTEERPALIDVAAFHNYCSKMFKETGEFEENAEKYNPVDLPARIATQYIDYDVIDKLPITIRETDDGGAIVQGIFKFD